jgi:hypothetical protein
MSQDDSSHVTEPKTANPEQAGTPATNRTRQGVTGHNVRYVLAISLVGIIVAFALVLLLVR